MGATCRPVDAIGRRVPVRAIVGSVAVLASGSTRRANGPFECAEFRVNRQRTICKSILACIAEAGNTVSVNFGMEH